MTRGEARGVHLPSARKFAIVVPQGAADEPSRLLDGRTPLMAAHLPHLRDAARSGRIGRTVTIPEGYPVSSEIDLLSVLGHDPAQYPVSRGRLEALARGVRLAPRDQAFRCNLMTVVDGVLRDPAAAYIPTVEASALLESLAPELPSEKLQLVLGSHHRHLLVWRDAGPLSRLVTTPPETMLEQRVARRLPRGRDSRLLRDLVQRSQELFASHDVNAVREDLGERPANILWPWGHGGLPKTPTFEARFGVRAACVAGVDVMRGLARLVRMEVLDVPGATGLVETDLGAKGRAAVAALDAFDLVLVHVEAADEAGHRGDVDQKVHVLESIDREIVGPLLQRLRGEREWRLVVLPGHATPCERRTHAGGAVPLLIAGSGIDASGAAGYDERAAAESEFFVEQGWELMEYVLRR